MKSVFTVKNWEESFVIDEKIAHATATYNMVGDLVGEVEVDYSIFYFNYNHEDVHSSTSRFEGFAVFKGEMSGEKGSFAYYDRGSFMNNEYKAEIEILEGSGTGIFTGFLGIGSYTPSESGMILTIRREDHEA